MKNKLFITDIRENIENMIINVLNNNQFMNNNVTKSPRAVGDTV